MPINDFRVVAVTPAGRKRYLSLLIPQLIKYNDAGVLDEYLLWVNTDNQDDINYMKEVAANNSFIKLRYLPDGVNYDGNKTIRHFFGECIEDQTVYVRFDDDVVVVDDVEAFKKFLLFRIDNPEYFLVYANILNNAIISHILQRFKKLDCKVGIAGYNAMDLVGWKSGEFALNIHDQVFCALKKDKSLSSFRFGGEWFLHECERVSINCVSWLGREFRLCCNGEVGEEEEYELACEMPKRLDKCNTIFGGYCCVHYAFGDQRSHLDSMELDKKYQDIMKELENMSCTQESQSP